MIRFALIFGWSILSAATFAEETATLKMRFVLDGAPPRVRQLNVGPIGPIVDESLLIDPKNLGIKNVVVRVDTGRRGSKIEVPPIKVRRRRLTTANGRFDPHILIARAGDTLELVDRSPNQHNVNLSFFANVPQAIAIRQGRPQLIPVPNPEPAPIPVGCDIQYWMRAYAVVLDHPFAAVSDSDGNLAIDGLPAGTSLKFRVWHEAGKIERVKVSNVETVWTRSQFNVDLAVGLNDIGDILVPAKSLTP